MGNSSGISSPTPRLAWCEVMTLRLQADAGYHPEGAALGLIRPELPRRGGPQPAASSGWPSWAAPRDHAGVNFEPVTLAGTA